MRFTLYLYAVDQLRMKKAYFYKTVAEKRSRLCAGLWGLFQNGILARFYWKACAGWNIEDTILQVLLS